MTKEAEEHASEDAKRKEMVEAHNNADSAIYTAEKAVKDLGDKIDDSMKKNVDDAVARVKEVIDSEDVEAIKKATDDLMEIVQGIGAAAYQAAGAAPEAGSAEGPADEGDGDGDEDVVDGEFKDAEE
jgi:molecular chaperone DnaK